MKLPFDLEGRHCPNREMWGRYYTCEVCDGDGYELLPAGKRLINFLRRHRFVVAERGS